MSATDAVFSDVVVLYGSQESRRGGNRRATNSDNFEHLVSKYRARLSAASNMGRNAGNKWFDN